ncbi:MurR/RpiR family transcriptional regulator [Lichenihabitans sp. PAMC28606]|uniref:MurR/RpiR family transcriptional regulator n=1 Tax=Lichenihabitans sp. PAMC28606 TaxID=2880932 RepID=UPI001D0BD01C|nr:MurR/RpiR family transcriptional regulator [Lichenihabitans sp. PAMC28606]UDL94459.1 MurR/RpiR family transcriptional regulator [Lichenihabitans sp. PAMC28606]
MARLHALGETGSPSDRRVAAVVLADPEFATRAAIDRLAERAGVSEPTVTRFCRTLGCDGLRDFKVRLAQSVASAGRYLEAASSGRVAGDSIPSAISAHACDAIERVCGAVDVEALGLAATLLTSARMIRAYGSGGSSSLAATELENRLFRLGLSISSHIDGEMQQMTAAAAQPGTVMVAYSVSGEVRSVVDAIGIAGLYGARTIAITAPGSSLASVAEIVLPFRIEEDRDVYLPSPARYALLALTDMLAAVVAKRIGPPALEGMRRIKHHQSLGRSNADQLPLGD